MKTFRATFLFTAVALLTASFASAQSIEALRKKQSSLELELERIKVQISEIESKASSPSETEKKPVWFIKDFGISQVNSAGGVEPFFVFINPNTNSPIKYITIRALLYNAVGDVISSEIGRQTTGLLSYTGPLSNADGEKRADWGPIWYNTTGDCIKLASIGVTFVNGKVLSFEGKNLKSALAPELANTCSMSKKG
jgi:hypothetical protein